MLILVKATNAGVRNNECEFRTLSTLKRTIPFCALRVASIHVLTCRRSTGGISLRAMQQYR